MLLEAKNAVVYGGGGSMGGAVARAFAREGARVLTVAVAAGEQAKQIMANLVPHDAGKGPAA